MSRVLGLVSGRSRWFEICGHGSIGYVAWLTFVNSNSAHEKHYRCTSSQTGSILGLHGQLDMLQTTARTYSNHSGLYFSTH